MARVLVLAAPQSGSGKTLVTLGLLRAFRNRGVKVAAAKVGPDYIDPQFHSAACGRPCINLDLWAMGPDLCRNLLNEASQGVDLMLVEGVMGLFDGPQGAPGSTADLAAVLGVPVLMVIDCSHHAQSIAALAKGFADFMPGVELCGVFLNRFRSDRHEALLRDALAGIDMPVLGKLRHTDSLVLPSRHLGLVQAHENQELEMILESAAAGVARETNLDKLIDSACQISNQVGSATPALEPLGQHMAVATDEAFSFVYPHLLSSWHRQGAEISRFSPLNDEPPNPAADAVFLPGGYPELHAGKLANNSRFLDGLRTFRALVYGECGGYMVLGETLRDAAGQTHAMAGLLPLETSFASRRLHLGYRKLVSSNGPWAGKLSAHEFHYATTTREAQGMSIFGASAADGSPLPPMGLRKGSVMGSFAHVISRSP